MSSDPITRLNAALEGRYSIERELGEGGMATVYLADDLKHERKVALKVLKPELAAVVGAERFLAEIKTTAKLQHPHILPLFDSGEADGFLFYVMPFVEGESLRDRLDREHQLPVAEAVKITTDLAEALDYAHRQKIIHRDIKPANILMHEGRPLIADFGIALAVGAAGGGRLTETGLSLGTPYYMSPEQATGDQFVGSSTDTYALGSVLYEMLVGEPPYPGTTAQAVLGKIIAGEPVSATKHRTSVPANVDAALGCALERLPADRFQSVVEFGEALVDSGFRHGSPAGLVGVGGGVHPRWRQLALAAGATTALLAAVLAWSAILPDAVAPVSRYAIELPEGHSESLNSLTSLAISPDGSTIVYVGPSADGPGQLWIRRRDELEPSPIPGTDGVLRVAFSPDGRRVAFSNGVGFLQSVSLGGEPPLEISFVGREFGLSWGDDGFVYFGNTEGVARVRATGGEPELVVPIDAARGEGLFSPHSLPDGGGILFTSSGADGGIGATWAYDLESGVRTLLFQGAFARYVPSGHLMYLSGEGVLLAVPFDLERFRVGSNAVALVQDVAMRGFSAAAMAVSDDGTLVYVTGITQVGNDLVWVNRTGVHELIDPTWEGARFSYPALSPDGTRLAVNVTRDQVDDVWVKQLDRGPAIRLTLDPAGGHRPAWTHDGTAVTYFRGSRSSLGGVQDDAWTRRADGSAPSYLEFDAELAIHEMQWSRDGAWFVYRTQMGGGIYGVSQTDTVMLVDTDATEFSPSLSPDGRFMAFAADETGRMEVYVIPFPNAGDARWPISPNGGNEVRWSAAGDEIFYRDASENMVAVPVTTEPGFSFGAPQVLFPAGEYRSGRVHPQYDVASDGERFVMVTQGNSSSAQLILVQNFHEELKSKVGELTTDPTSRLNAALEGRYRIERELGEGGMATVYLADDLKHERKVALKVLKPELAAVVGAERFLAEIKTTANLQHPHILPLFDSGEADTFLFYVMPYVEGETLGDRLARDHQLPVADAVEIAKNVAEALDYAHSHGVIHRDIKPDNILLQAGKPVISDFGIALAVGAAGGGRLTETGLSLGTPHYMSPEQATGETHVGPTTDIYALGCVLYEMLVGEPPYTGSTAQAVLGKIITAEPERVRELRKAVPPHVDAVIRRALEKLSADRFTSAGDFAKALADPQFRHGVAPIEAAGAKTAWNRLSLAMTGVAAIAVLTAAIAFMSRAPVAPSRVVSFTVPVGEDAEVFLGGELDARFGRPSGSSLTISPDGSLVVYAAWGTEPDGGIVSRLYQRRLDRESAVPIQGTEGGEVPFFSPDGAWVGFFAGPSLRRVSMADGAVETILQDAISSGTRNGPLRAASWGDDGTILYTDFPNLYRVPATGGEPQLVIGPDPGSEGPIGFAHPHHLPGSESLLLTGVRSLDPETSEVLVLDLATGGLTPLLTDAADPHFLETGHLLLLRQGTLMAVGFDPGRGEIVGEPILVLEDVMQALGMPNVNWESLEGQLAISTTGDLVFARGGRYPPRPRELMIVGTDGQAEPLGLEPAQFGKVRVSPDGERLAFSVREGRASNLFVYDFARRVTEPLNAGVFRSDTPEWSPDGTVIAFQQDVDGVPNVFKMAAGGEGEPERLAPSDQGQSMMSWSSQGAIAYRQGGDIWVIPPDGQPEPFITSAATESYATFSPDGRWLAYVSDQTGRPEAYVRPYPGPGGATLISDEGAGGPVWSPDGRQIYFLDLGTPTSMMVVDAEPGEEFQAGPPRPLISPWIYGGETPSRNYDMMADGSFVANESLAARQDREDGVAPLGDRTRFRVEEFYVVLNWFEVLRERMGGS